MSALAEIHALADAAGAQLGGTAAFAPPDGAWTEPPQKYLAAVAMATVDATGDGAALTLVLTRAVLAGALQHLASGGEAAALRAGLESAREKAVAALIAEARPLNELEDFVGAVIAASRADPWLAKMMSYGARSVGPGGSLSIGPPGDAVTVQQVRRGLAFDRGWLSPWFATDPAAFEAVLQDPYILLLDAPVETGSALAPILKLTAAEGRPLLVICHEAADAALSMLVLNKLIGACQVTASKPPDFGGFRTAWLEDLAVLTGGKVVSSGGLASVSLRDLGRAGTVRQSADRTEIIDAKGEAAAIEARIGALTAQLADVDAPHTSYEIEKLSQRLDKLSRGVAIVELSAEDAGAPPAVSDARKAALAAVEEGAVVGGGGALVKAAAALADMPETGAKILRAAMAEPARWIARNAGVDDEAVVAAQAAARSGFGFNPVTGRFEDLRAAGALDLAMTVRLALSNAVQVASSLMTDAALIAEARASPRIGLPPAERPLRPLDVVAGAVWEAAAEQRSDVCLVLIDTGDRDIKMIHELKKLRPELGLAEATKLVKSPPQTIQTGLKPKEAEQLRDQFADLGITVEIR